MAPRAIGKLSQAAPAYLVRSLFTGNPRPPLPPPSQETGTSIWKTGDVIQTNEHQKGYAVGNDRFIIVRMRNSMRFKIESTQTIDIETFVPASEIDRRHLDAWPADEALASRAGERRKLSC